MLVEVTQDDIDKQERAFLERITDSFGLPAVLNELRAICEVWAERADDNEQTEIFYKLCAGSLATLSKHIANEIAKLQPPEAV